MSGQKDSDQEIVAREAAELEAKKQQIETLRAQYKEAQETDLNQTARALDEQETKLVEDNLDAILKGETVEGLDKTIETTSQPFIEKVIRVASNSKEKEKNIKILLLAMIDKKISAGSVGAISRKLMIENLKDNKEFLKKFYEAMFVTPISARILLEAIGDNKENLQTLFETVKNDTEGNLKLVFQGIVGSALAILIKNIGLKNLEKLLTENQKAELLETDIDEKDKVELFKKIEKELKVDSKNINSYSTNGIISILKYLKLDKDQALYTKTLEGLSANNKELVSNAFGLREEEGKKGQAPTEEGLEQTTLENEKFEVEIGKKNIKFNINGVERSFLTKKYIVNDLDGLKTQAEKKLYCYKKLLDIIKRDGSMDEMIGGKPNPDFNKHNVAGGDNELFKKSNAKLQEDISRLEGLTSGKAETTAPKADQAEVNEGEAGAAAPETQQAPSGQKAQQAHTAPESRGSGAPEAPVAPAENPDRQVDDISDAIKTLKEMGVEIQAPLKLTVREFNGLKEFANRMKSEMDKAEDVISLLNVMKEISQNLKNILSKSDIQVLKFKYENSEFIWTKSLPFGFGDEDEMINKILDIKKAQFQSEPKKYTQFFEISRTKLTDKRENINVSFEQTKYFKNYESYINANFPVDEKIGALSEEEMVSAWPDLDGFKGVEIVLTSPPFSQFREAAPVKVAQIISEWSNQNVEFSHIFIVKDLFKGVDESILPKKFTESASAFKDEIARLQENESKLTAEEKTRLSYMFHYVYFPCVQLLEGIQKLKLKTKVKTNEEEVESEDNVQVREGLEKFFKYTERSAGIFEKFITAMSADGASSVNMSDINGKTFLVDKGRLQRKFDPEAALKILIKRQGMYTFENDEKVLDDKALTDEVNRLIQLGLTNVNIRNKTDKKIDGIKITTLKNATFTPEQMELFQLGYLIDQASRFTEQIEEGLEAVKETSPALEKILDDLVKKGVSQSVIPEIRKHLLLVAGAQFEDGKFNSAMIGVPIKISDKVSIQIGLGANTKGEVLAGIGASVEVYENGSFKARAVAEIDVQGFTVGSSQSIDIGMVQLSAFEGFRWSWTNLLPTVGGGLMISWNTDKQLRKDIDEKERASGFKDAFEEWKKIPKGDVEKRYQALKSIGKIWERLGPIQAAYNLKNADVVHIVENIQEELTNEAVEDLSSSPIPLIASIGIGLVGGIPMPIVGIKLGSAKVSVPERREIAKILATLSNARVEKDLKDAIAKFDGKTAEMVVYMEVTGEIVYSKEGLLMIKESEDSGKLDLSTWKTDSLESANETLEKANMRIKIRQLENDRIEIKILDTDNQDTELYTDPLLHTLAIAKDGSKLIIEGNVKDLVISRERFTLPFKGSARVSSIREKITIRQSTSVAGRRDGRWIEENSNGFLQKLENENEYHLYKGNRRGPSKNLFEKYEDGMEKFKEFRPTLKGKIGTKEVAEYDLLLKDREQALKALTVNDYDKQIVRDNLFTSLDSFYDGVIKTEKTPGGLYETMARKMDRPEEILKFLKTNTKDNPELKDLNDKETNLALMHILNRWFTTIYKKEKTDKKTTRKLKDAIKERIEYFKNEVFEPEIKEAIFRINTRRVDGKIEKIKTPAKELTNKLIDQIYGKLLKQIEQKDFDFTKLETSPITDGAILVSASRIYRDGQRDPSLVETVNYNTLSKEKALIHAFGFLKDTVNTEKLDPNNELARVMLEIASPLPIEDEKFLRAPFTLKLLGMKALILIQGNEDFKLITEAIKNPTLLQVFDGPHKAALERFKDLAEEIRNAQIEGKTLEYKIKDTGLIVKLDMKAKIETGAYSKCVNATFTVEERGQITVIREATGEVVGVFKETDEMIDAKLDKIFTSIAITGLNTRKARQKAAPAKPDKPKPEEPKIPSGKVSAEGGGESAANTAPPHVGTVKINSNGTTAEVSSGPGNAGVAAGSHNSGQNTKL